MTETRPVRGIHHITALAGDAARNVAFYTGVMGLRLVKRTVNFDEPGTWHLYYGDEAGRPGTILTFFPFPALSEGRHGTGQAVDIGFAVQRGALGYWMGRLTEKRVGFEGPMDRFGERVLRFKDPDGLQLELVTDDTAGDREGWAGSEVPGEHALRGFQGVTLWEQGYERTAKLLTDRLGFEAAGQEESRFRFAVPGSREPGAIVDIRCIPNFWSGSLGAGTIHHVAFRAADEADQSAMRDELAQHGVDVTPTLDRSYFRSVYFREPGGVLFEIATDPPGFTADEPLESLGEMLKLPDWLEPRRDTIERLLPPIEADPTPGGSRGRALHLPLRAGRRRGAPVRPGAAPRHRRWRERPRAPRRGGGARGGLPEPARPGAGAREPALLPKARGRRVRRRGPARSRA